MRGYVIIENPITPRTCRYTTVQNIVVESVSCKARSECFTTIQPQDEYVYIQLTA